MMKRETKNEIKIQGDQGQENSGNIKSRFKIRELGHFCLEKSGEFSYELGKIRELSYNPYFINH